MIISRILTLQKFAEALKSLKEFVPSFKNANKCYVPKTLKSCKHVWLRVDRVRRPLEAPYTGPHEVVERSEKYFVIKGYKNDLMTVSIDRLKPYVCKVNESKRKEEEKNLPSPEPDVPKPERTRSGRRIKWAKSVDFNYY